MSFSVYRKHQKALLLAATVISVVVFVLFPSFGDVNSSLGGVGADDVIGQFTVNTTGAPRAVTSAEFRRTYERLARFTGNRSGLTEEMVWQHILLVADARGAGLQVADQDLVHELQNQLPGITAEMYNAAWKSMGFSSARAFEDFFKERVLVDRWMDIQFRRAGVVDADEVYQRWRVDNELYDSHAIVFPDADPESIADPGDEVLEAYYDDTPEYLRERNFADPARYDVAYAWLPLDADLTAIPGDKLEGLPEVTDTDAELRFQQLRASRWPDVEEATPEILAQLTNELMVSNLVAEAHRAWIASKDEAVGPAPDEEGAEDEPNPFAKEAFTQFMTEYGMRLGDPQGLLGPDELEALEDIGTAVLAAQLSSMTEGQTRYFRPFGEDLVAEVVYVEELQDAVPLEFAEAREMVLEQWRGEDEQRAAAAHAFREALTAAARAVPEAAELIAPLEEQAVTAANNRISAAKEAGDDVDEEAIRAEEMEAVQGAIDARVAEFESRFWDDQVAAALAAGGGAVSEVRLTGVSKAYRLDPDGDEAADSIERFLKINSQVHQQEVDGITPVLRHTAGKSSVVVRVTGREFPPQADMLADKESFDQSRERVAQSKRFTFQIGFTPASLMGPRSDSNPYGHDVMLIQQEEPAAEGSGEPPTGE